MRRFFAVLMFVLGGAASLNAQIAVNPTGVNVNSQNPTTVFLTFGPLPPDYVPAEAIWCGELIPATPPAIGQQCRPDTIYGSLPIRYNRSTASGTAGFTDIMAIPPAVVRRAYQAAVAGASAGFFYVRRFVSTIGNPDQFVNVTCRMTGGGARVPFALTNVEIKTPTGEPVLFIKSGEKLPPLKAVIQYNGTGRLKGRWEIVQPGEDLPSDRDLLTEATLPIEERGTQKRFTQITRFNHFLLPAGKFELDLDAGDRIPSVLGQYVLLLRLEAVDDKESDSNLAAVGAGPGVVHSGAVASFPMPTLRFYVVGESPTAVWETSGSILPFPDSKIKKGDPVIFTWKELPDAVAYRLEIKEEGGREIMSALLPAQASSYRAPSWLADRSTTGKLVWNITALDASWASIATTKPKVLTIE